LLSYAMEHGAGKLLTSDVKPGYYVHCCEILYKNSCGNDAGNLAQQSANFLLM
jgi:hypothetical protein